jgi:hypothetical protein
VNHAILPRKSGPSLLSRFTVLEAYFDRGIFSKCIKKTRLREKNLKRLVILINHFKKSAIAKRKQKKSERHSIRSVAVTSTKCGICMQTGLLPNSFNICVSNLTHFNNQKLMFNILRIRLKERTVQCCRTHF